MSSAIISADCGAGAGSQTTDIYGNVMWAIPTGAQNILSGDHVDLICTVAYPDGSGRPEMQRVSLNDLNHCLEIRTTTKPSTTISTSTSTFYTCSSGLVISIDQVIDNHYLIFPALHLNCDNCFAKLNIYQVCDGNNDCPRTETLNEGEEEDDCNEGEIIVKDAPIYQSCSFLTLFKGRGDQTHVKKACQIHILVHRH